MSKPKPTVKERILDKVWSEYADGQTMLKVRPSSFWIGRLREAFNAGFERGIDFRAEAERPQGDGWIAVKERLPDDYHEVDVWFDVPASLRSMGFSDQWREPKCYRKEGKWVHLYKGEQAELESGYITHWREMPSPPADKAAQKEGQ